MTRKLADVKGTLVFATWRAYKFRSEQTNVMAWIPRSQCETDPPVDDDMSSLPMKVTITCPEDQAQEKGWI